MRLIGLLYSWCLGFFPASPFRKQLMHTLKRFRSVLLVANPTSGGGRAARKAAALKRILRREGCRADLLCTGEPGQAQQVAGEVSKGSLIVAVGGDGTFNEILNGADLGKTVLGIVPAGTGNVLAKELGMRHSPAGAAEQMASAGTVPLDVATCNGRRFISVFGAGIDGEVVRCITRARGQTLTQLHYLPHILRAVLPLPRHEVCICVDGQPLACAVHQVTVANTHSYGGPIEMAPGAAPNDGLLDVMAVRVNSLPKMASVALAAILRALHQSRQVRYARGRSVALSADKEGVPYQIDGEAAGVLPATVRLAAQRARVLVPNTFRPIRREPAAAKAVSGCDFPSGRR